ncbi:JAML protein, partial [Penelope pileata]|nr:JAML protein [Penelope pileata]
ILFYYYNNSSIPVGRFRQRVRWRGDVSRWDGSIQLRDVRVNDSGTYTCEIRLFQLSSIFKNRTVLLVSPAAQRDGGAASAQGSTVMGHNAVWAVTLGCSTLAVVLAFLAGLSLRKRSAANTALERSKNDDSKDKAKEGLYCSIPETRAPKAEQDAGKKRRAEETYITMHPSFFHENGVYVELARGAIPAEWMAEGRREDGCSEEPQSRAREELPRAPEGQK